MYVKGPDNPLLTLSNAASPGTRGGWQAGQLLKAMVVSVDQEGTPTLEINGRQVTAQSQGGLALRLGQMLQLEVVETGETPLLKVLNPPANPQETMTRGVRESLPQQQPLTQVLNSLQQLAQGAKGEAGQQLRALSRQLMEQLPQPQQLQSGAGVKQAVEDSGHFLEAKLQQLLRGNSNSDPQAQLGRDLKAGLLRLLQAVRALQQGSSGSATTTRAPAATTTAQATSSPQSQAAAATVQTSSNPQAPAPSSGASQAQAQAANTPQAANLPQSNTPPSQSGSLPASQSPLPQEAAPGNQSTAQGTQEPPQAAQTSQANAQAAQTIASQKGDMTGPELRQAQQPVHNQAQAQAASPGHTSSQDAAQATAKSGMHTGQQQLESGLARIQFNQLHSLQQSDNQLKPSWLLEIPIRQAEGRVNTLQLEIQRDREGDGKEKQAIWSLSLSFDLKELGAVRAGLTLVGEKQVGINLWVDRASTAELFQQHMEQLRKGMQEAGLYVSRVGVQQGIPEPTPRHKPFADNTLVDVQA